MISARDYDKRVIEEGLQFQAEHFYEPRMPADKRRIACVLSRLDPKPGEKILDIGCGTGTFAYQCARAGAHAAGFDYSGESLRAAVELCGMRQVPGSARFAAAHVAAMPFASRTFDKAVAADVIEHMTDAEKEALLEELRRVLKPRARAVIFTPNKWREDLAAACWRARHPFAKRKPPVNELHFGLTSRRAFERLLKKRGFLFDMRYEDVTRPLLALIPLVRAVLALNLVWIIRPADEGERL